MKELLKLFEAVNPNMTVLDDEKGFFITKIDESLGSGTIKSIEISKGIFLAFSDVKFGEEAHYNHKSIKSSIEINYCLEGIVEGKLKNGRRFGFRSDEYGCFASDSVEYISMCNRRFCGINILLVIDEATQSISDYTKVEYDTIKRFLSQLGKSKSVNVKITSMRIRNIFKELYVLPDKFYKEQLQLKVMELLLCLMSFDEYSDEANLYLPISFEEKIITVHKFLLENINDRYTIPQLANMVGTNSTDLMKGFKAIYGCTIHVFLTKERMNTAKKLLETTELKVSEIAKEVGYINTGKFIEVFKKRYKITPNEIRKMYN